ncbi:LOW QUALITY PROTEIN: FXYD domain-containing ion transport regulator 3 [Halichoerus grypus]|uniref:LOW QUALITY PROTEIN: FXYD domain-containing ion transport regulator 3 n=1 Tax=Halichoerus grypus TaxID=9711 RepID=UPI001658FA16|nr:LOW QUALITY PROTEIN: FXYD domain-containing ion transport regulator 3 [Halichoerus grypus]
MQIKAGLRLSSRILSLLSWNFPSSLGSHTGQLADMQEVTLSLFILLAGLPALDANDPEDKNSPFYYDWRSLRIGGLICAAVLCTIGIIVLMSEWTLVAELVGQGCGSPPPTIPFPLTGGKCKCKFSQKPSHHPGDAPPLITPGSAQNC